MTPEQFIGIVAPVAVQLRGEGSPLLPSVRIAQAMLETGSQIPVWNNLVGYKVGSGRPNAYWHGQSVTTLSWEVENGARMDGVPSDWRVYDSIADCFRDQDLLFQSSRYDRVRAAQSPQEQAAMLLACGYATDPAYADKLDRLIARYKLESYDTTAAIEEEESMTLKLEQDWQWTMLAEALEGLHAKGFFTDTVWVDKARSKELTISELTWLNTIMYARQNGVEI
ncbi:glucosaminidase domain-containing protein [Paenibacillus filicis]|uniref:Glucosaminidase domain-containing protein n=1 Tax=Paenibacillus gyeongsangnamensis TaxID=3388067 RepID=A0ABT4Q6S2_9BACL|nr:glucosaminidase domain-containing protein [Paenibacillus filicis]MCZ8512482.1 glucosaminidase domain-containing protein [Paenibacillus filicis]